MSSRRDRRTVRRAIRRSTATAVRREIEQAQRDVALADVTDPRRERGVELLTRYGVTRDDVVTQSRRRVRGWWRVYAQPVNARDQALRSAAG